ncbi:FAD-dependent oxidoreductase, partial [Streptococcus suis]
MQIIFADGSNHIAQKFLCAIGRKPNIDKLNLKATRVQLTSSEHISVNESQETAVPGIYALGDVTGVKEVTPVAI